MLQLPSLSFVLLVYVCVNLAFPAAFSTVPTVTNISLTCHNFNNVLYWNYSAPDPIPKFTVRILGYQNGRKMLDTNQTYLEISKYTQDAGDVYYIEVEAEGNSSDNSSTVSSGFSFSYNEDISADIRCSMDFPDVNISVLQSRVKLSFLHPYYVYNLEALKYEFGINIYYNKAERYYICYEDEDVCTVEFQLSESLYNNCINVQLDGSVDGIRAITDKNVCYHEAPYTKNWPLILVIVLGTVSGLVLLIIVGIIIFKKATQPQSCNTGFNHWEIVKSHPVHIPEQPFLSEVVSIGNTPLLSTDQTCLDTSSPLFDESIDFPTHFKLTAKLPDEQDNVEITEEPDSDYFNSENSFSGYDSQKFPIDMGQGDMVEGYGPR